MLFFFFAFDILNILYFYCFFYSFHNFVAFDRFVDLLCCYAQLDFTCSRVRPLKHCIIFSLVYSYFFFLRFRSFSVLYFLFRKKDQVIFVLSCFSITIFFFACWLLLAGYRLCFSMLYIGYSHFFRPLFSFQEKRLGQFFVAIFFFTCWLSLAGCRLLFLCYTQVANCFLLFLFAVFPCSFSLLISLLISLLFLFDMVFCTFIFLCSVHV